MAAFGLLPSPPISESRPASAGPESSYFDCKSSDESDDSKEETETETDAENTQDEDPALSVLSDEGKISYRAYRPPDWKEQHRTDVMNVHEAHSEFVRQCESKDKEEPKEQGKTSMSITSPKSVYNEKGLSRRSSPRPQRPRTTTVSSEASWVPSNFSYCERWLQNVPVDRINDKDTPPRVVNRRKVQIVENDPPMPKLDIIPGAKALEEPVRFVVASACKTKPKLVDIARQSSPSIPLPPPPTLLPQIIPTTPDQRQEEVSAFSPDTPLDMSDSGYGTRDSGYSIESYDDSKDDDDAYTDPGSLTSDSVTSTVVCERPESSHEEREAFPHPEIRSGSVSPKASSQRSLRSPVGSSNMSDKEDEKQRLWHHDWTSDDHEWTLDELDHSVKDFPRHMLRLTSPVIVFLRKNDEKALLRPFRTIFPDVTENLLDCLCAALLARNYLLSLSSIHRRKPSVSTRNDPYAVDAVPTKAYSTLGIQIPSGSPGKMNNRVLGSRSADLRRELERIIDNLLFAICGRSDPTLKSAVEVLAQVLETNA
ncbi:hypothetical protein PENARI_c006G12228 [Penicillium arizonense]|uniref:Uncharacterized protein n=1 Tax=Penicillium arizonense TaxID=1835702 RepID=A0A1F5LMG8_PENAI|nr:hypothetical protein PENARI_c006G12228 [Penicillium arizonense]OGE54317.1 hypothetical protein PENARI_c006G12228 [Penicillium arizonense]